MKQFARKALRKSLSPELHTHNFDTKSTNPVEEEIYVDGVVSFLDPSQYLLKSSPIPSINTPANNVIPISHAASNHRLSSSPVSASEFVPPIGVEGDAGIIHWCSCHVRDLEKTRARMTIRMVIETPCLRWGWGVLTATKYPSR